MKAMNHVSSISYPEAVPSTQDDDARVVLLVTADAALSHRLIRALTGNGDLSRPNKAREIQVPIATSVAQARSCIGRAVPAVILLDESAAAPGQFTNVLRDFAQIAPIVFLAASENLARWCALGELSNLVTQGRVDCVQRQGDFVPLATRLIERHANRRAESLGFRTGRYAGSSTMTAAANRVPLDPEDAPLDFGEVLRHEVNNPLTGILGNAELLLSRRDRMSADMVERLEIIADLAIRLRETIRRLSNALERRTARIPAQPTSGLIPSLRHRSPT
jgi:signal transduction histidine kinase